MSTLSDNVARIRESLRPGAPPPRREELLSTSTVYAEACARANTRLGRCHEFLRRGLIAEAVHHAEIEPDVLDSAAALALPEFDQWAGLCEQLDLPAAQPLREDVVTALNDAFAEDVARREILRQWRQVNLSREPLRVRLKVLRALASTAPGFAGWTEDLEAHEIERLREIPEHISQHLRAGAVVELVDLLSELTEQPWRTHVPESLLADARKALRRLELETTACSLRELLPRLDDAYLEQDFDSASALVDEWRRIVRGAGITVPPDLAQRIDPIALWVDQQAAYRQREHEFRNTCAQLRAAAEESRPVSELLRLQRQLESFELPVPEDLSELLRREIDRQRVLGGRRHRMRMSVIVGASLAAVLLTALWIQHRTRLDFVQQYAERLTKMLKDDRIEDARAEWNRLATEQPALARYPLLEELLDALKTSEQTEKSRAAKFAELWEQWKKAADAWTTNEWPSDGPIKEMEKNKRRKGLKDEAEKIADAWDRIDIQRSKVRGAADVALERELNTIDVSVKQSPPLTQTHDSAQLEEWGNQLHAARAELVRLVDTFKHASDHLHDRAALLNKSIELGLEEMDRIRQQIEMAIQLDRDIESLRELAEKPGELADRLQELQEAAIRCAAGTPRERDLTAAAKNKALWVAVRDWEAIVAKEHRGELVPRSLNALNSLRSSLDGHMSRHPESQSPMFPLLAAYKAFLATIQPHFVVTEEQSENLVTAVQRCLEGRPMRDLACIVNGERRFYLDATQKPQKGCYQVYEDPNFGGTKKLPFDQSTTPAPAPQCALGDKCKRKLDGSAEPLLQVLDIMDVIRRDDRVDPLLRLILLIAIARELTDRAKEDLTLKELSNRLAEVSPRVNELNWVYPPKDIDGTVEKTRERVKQLLNSFPGIGEAKRKILEEREFYLSRLAWPLRGHGVLIKPGNVATVGCDPGLLFDGARFLVVATPPRDPLEPLVEIGRVVGDRQTLTAAGGFPEGTWVIIVGPQPTQQR